MKLKQNLIFDDLELFQPEDIINIDEYLSCYGEDSYQTIDDTHQATTMPTLSITQNNTEDLDKIKQNVLISIPTEDVYSTNELQAYLEDF